MRYWASGKQHRNDHPRQNYFDYPGDPDIPCFLLLDDPANELLLPFGLGSHRILPQRLADLWGGGQPGEGADLRLAAANQSELIEMMITNSASANAMPISQRTATDYCSINLSDWDTATAISRRLEIFNAVSYYPSCDFWELVLTLGFPEGDCSPNAFPV